MANQAPSHNNPHYQNPNHSLSSTSSSHYHSSLRHPPLRLGFQEHHKWDKTCFGDDDQIQAQVNCPRYSNLMTVLFSTRPLSIIAGEIGIYQALNLCPNCKTAFYFRPFKLVPLQGSFIEIGRVKARDDGESGRGGGRVWEKLRSYGRDGAERGRSGVEVENVVGQTVEVKRGIGEGSGWGGGSVRKELPTPKEIFRRLDELVIGRWF